MRRSLLTYLEDINLAVSDIEDFTKNQSLAQYQSDRMVQSAVERKFILIGEVFAQMEQHFPGNRQRIVRCAKYSRLPQSSRPPVRQGDIDEVFEIARGPMLQLKSQVDAWIVELDPTAAP